MSESVILACPHCHALNRVPRQRLGDGGKCGQCRQPLFTGRPLALRGDTFDAHAVRSDLPLLVDFWAPWCGPCRMFAPTFEQAAGRLEPQVRFAKVNTEEEQALAARFAIRSIPTLVLFRGGHELARVSGAMDPASLTRWLQAQLTAG